MEQFNMQELLLEASKFRSELLKDLDDAFSLLKKDNKSIKAKKKVTDIIQEFSKIKTVVFNTKSKFLNASVIPVYDQLISSDLINILKDYQASGNIRNLEIVEEPSKYIKKIYVIFGIELINTFSPRELTAIFLHELGHVFTYTSNLPRILLALVKNTVGTIGQFFKTPILYILNIFTLPIYFMTMILIITFVRTLTFLEHKSEYRADQFAAKYGYGDEMIKVLYKFHNKYIETESKKAWYKKIWDYIEEIFVPSSHPQSSKRIEELSEKMSADYKKLYPNLNKELSIILRDIKA